MSLIPVITLGILMFLVAADRIANGIYNEAYVGMQATTLAVRDIFEVGNSGPYHIDENGMMWKGDTLNISQTTDITDHIKENTGMEVTVFWGDTRILTSIVNEHGERQINTQASETVVDRVLKKGEVYQNRDVEILGTKYIVCYLPVYIDIEPGVLNRKDEIGDLGKNILHLKNSLYAIVKNIHTKSEELGSDVTHIESIRFLSQQANQTNESVAKISSAAELITAIASQTNLLSLNASIEAARAGEHGRGFSVVASEIQQLSEQSNNAAGHIQEMITNLNTNSTHTLDRVNQV